LLGAVDGMPQMNTDPANCRWVAIRLTGITLGLLMGLLFPRPSPAMESWTGRRIMEEAFSRHDLFPYVFEEQTMIMLDRAGNRDVRRARRFSRVEKDGAIKYLLVFDNPAEVRGVALLVVRHRSGALKSGVYLPAFGKKLKSSSGKNRSSHVLGTDFAIEDLTAEILSDFRYVRTEDTKVDAAPCFVVEAFPLNREIERTTGYSLRRLFVQQNNFFIIRTDYYDRRGRFSKSQSRHDLKRVDGKMWRANMILMENVKERHKTLIKINRRVFSHHYVPADIFTTEWLLENRHVMRPEQRHLQKNDPSPEEND